MAAPLLRRATEPQRGIDPEVVAFQQFFGTLAANPSVRLIGIDTVAGYADLWVRLGDDDEGNGNAIYTALSGYHTTPSVETPIDLHVISADEADTALPADIQLLFHRPQ
jgi:hypothetical protein